MSNAEMIEKEVRRTDSVGYLDHGEHLSFNSE